MKILLTGAAGFVGKHLRTRLEKEGHEVTCLKRGEYPHAFPAHDIIINCAAEIQLDDRMVETNVYLTWGLLRLAQRHGSRLIQIGSSSETGPIEGLRSETTPCQPSDLYEATKLAATCLCLGYAGQYDLDICVARPFSLYGSGDKPRMLIPTLWRTFCEGGVFHCSPGGHDWLHIDDFAEGIMALISAPREVTKGQIYHFGTGINTPNRDIVRLFEAAAGSLRQIVYTKENARDYDVMDWRADSSKARANLGWAPRVGIEEGIRRYVSDEWFQKDLG